MQVDSVPKNIIILCGIKCKLNFELIQIIKRSEVILRYIIELCGGTVVCAVVQESEIHPLRKRQGLRIIGGGEGSGFWTS